VSIGIILIAQRQHSKNNYRVVGRDCAVGGKYAIGGNRDDVGDVKRSMKYIFCLIFALLVLLSGCSLLIDRDDPYLEYGGEQYHIVRTWQIIDRENYTQDNAGWDGNAYKVFVYPDLQKRFIFDEYYQLLYHKVADQLPSVKDLHRIDRIEIVFSDVNKYKVVLNDSLIIEKMVQQMNQPFDRDAFNNNSPFKRTVAAISVYYQDYPAYQMAVSAIKAKDGSYGFIVNDWADTEKVGPSDYIPIPSDSPIQSLLE
jgi:uncharacterized protein YceK